jgi:hypothetical protein
MAAILKGKRMIVSPISKWNLFWTTIRAMRRVIPMFFPAKIQKEREPAEQWTLPQSAALPAKRKD